MMIYPLETRDFRSRILEVTGSDLGGKMLNVQVQVSNSQRVLYRDSLRELL